MKSVTDAKGLQRLNTATTKRIRTKPPQHGTAHLDMYLLSTQKLRLEQELAQLNKRRDRIHQHMAEIVERLVKLRLDTQQDDTVAMSRGTQTSGVVARPSSVPDQRLWSTMRLGY